MPATHRLLILALLLLPASVINALETRFYQTRHISPEHLAEALKPLLLSGERISANGDRLILVAGPDSHDAAQAVLAELDQPPAQYRVSLYHGPRPPGGGYATNRLGRVHQVMVGAGKTAHLQTGGTREQLRLGPDGVAGVATEEIPQGLEVRVIPEGKQLAVALSGWADFQGHRGLQRQRLHTQLRVDAGHWYPVGGSGRLQPDSRRYQSRPDAAFWLRVDAR